MGTSISYAADVSFSSKYNSLELVDGSNLASDLASLGLSSLRGDVSNSDWLSKASYGTLVDFLVEYY